MLGNREPLVGETVSKSVNSLL